MRTTTSFRRIALSAALAATIGLGLAACSSSAKTATTTDTTAAGASTTTTSSAPGVATTSIAIQGFMFKPTPASAKVGATITVTNGDGTDHSLTADDGSFDTGKFSSGSKTISLTKAGTFAFHCKVHDYMKGSIQVSG